MRATVPPSGLLVAMLASVAAAFAAPVKPWTAEGDVGCDWWLSGPNGKEHHASIGTGDDDPVLTISAQAFLPFTEEQTVPLVLRFNRDPKREASAEAWSSSVVGANEQGEDGERMLGMYLRPPARAAMGGATFIEVVHDGKVLTAIPLAETPSQADLDACVRPPKTEDSDEE